MDGGWGADQVRTLSCQIYVKFIAMSFKVKNRPSDLDSCLYLYWLQNLSIVIKKCSSHTHIFIYITYMEPR